MDLSKYKYGAEADLRKILHDYRDDWAQSCEKSRQRYVLALPPGEKTPVGQALYYQDEIDGFNARCLNRINRATEIVSDIRTILKKKLTEAPSNEAMNAISLLKMRNHITPEELEDYADRYGSNPSVYSAIVEIAKDHEIRGFPDHPVVEDLGELDSIEKCFRDMSAISAKSGRADPGYIAFMEIQFDPHNPIKTKPPEDYPGISGADALTQIMQAEGML